MVKGYCSSRVRTFHTRHASTNSSASSNRNTVRRATRHFTSTQAVEEMCLTLVSSSDPVSPLNWVLILSIAEKISSMVRSVSVNDQRPTTAPAPTPAPAPAQPTPSSWEDHNSRPPSRGSAGRQAPLTQATSRGSLRDAASDRFPTRSGHTRDNSDATAMTGGVASSGGYPETMQSGPRRQHEYDLQAMEASLASPKAVARNPIPAPTVTVRSEFPTINRSRQQQTLTCLITIEVSDNKWRPDPDDLQSAPPASMQRIEEQFAQRPPSPARSAQSAPRFYPYESPEVLEEMTENLRSRVDNWHGLDFSRYVKMRSWMWSCEADVAQFRKTAPLWNPSSWERQGLVAGA